MTMDALKQDPLYAGFLKGAHSRGINNAQLSWVLAEYAQRMTPNPAVAEAELRKVWPDDATLNAALGRSHRATSTFGKELMERLDAKFGNDPDFIMFTERVGAELGEDKGVNTGITAVEQESLESLMSHPSYIDTKHPEHDKTVARVRALYAKKFPQNLEG
jgi:hypothetical protein